MSDAQGRKTFLGPNTASSGSGVGGSGQSGAGSSGEN